MNRGRPQVPKNHCTRLTCVVLLFFLCATPLLSQDQTVPILPPKKGDSINLQLFNGKDISDWLGDTDSWQVEDSVLTIRDGVSSAQVRTAVSFSDFRLTAEFLASQRARLGIGFWTAEPENSADYQADTEVLVGSQFGIARQQRMAVDFSEKAGPLLVSEASSDEATWNRLEVLAQGNRLRVALNGHPLADWYHPAPEEIKAGAIAVGFQAASPEASLQLRKLHLETFPLESQLVTLNIDQRIAEVAPTPLELNVDPDSENLWSKNPSVVLPTDLLLPFIHPEHGLKHIGIRTEESNAFYAVLEKARISKLKDLRKGASEWREIRRQAAGNEAYRDRESKKFPTFIDLYHNPNEYLGKLVTFRGHIRKLIKIPADENPYGIKEYYEAWLFDGNAQNHPAVILSTSIDEELVKQVGADIEVDFVGATGYFVKNMGYEAQDTYRFAPLIIAKKLEVIRRTPADPFALSKSTQWLLICFAILVAFWARFFFRLHKGSELDEQQREQVREIVARREGKPDFEQMAEVDSPPDFSSYGQDSDGPTASS